MDQQPPPRWDPPSAWDPPTAWKRPVEPQAAPSPGPAPPASPPAYGWPAPAASEPPRVRPCPQPGRRRSAWPPGPPRRSSADGTPAIPCPPRAWPRRGRRLRRCRRPGWRVASPPGANRAGVRWSHPARRGRTRASRARYGTPRRRSCGWRPGAPAWRAGGRRRWRAAAPGRSGPLRPTSEWRPASRPAPRSATRRARFSRRSCCRCCPWRSRPWPQCRPPTSPRPRGWRTATSRPPGSPPAWPERVPAGRRRRGPGVRPHRPGR